MHFDRAVFVRLVGWFGCLFYLHACAFYSLCREFLYICVHAGVSVCVCMCLFLPSSYREHTQSDSSGVAVAVRVCSCDGVRSTVFSPLCALLAHSMLYSMRLCILYIFAT